MNEEISEANRYLTNAKEILSQKAGKENGAYSDKKYVLMVGHSAYMGVLHSLDQLNLPNNKKRRNTMEYFQIFLNKYDRKLFNDYNDIYNVLHLSLGYDEVLNSKNLNEGKSMVKQFIQKIATRVN